MGDQKAVEVTWEDQSNINKFGKLNHKHQVLRSSLQDKQKRLEHLDEAQNELMLVDDEDSTRYLVGECFLHVENEAADEKIGTEMQKIQSEIEDLSSQQSELKEEMDVLKQTLYAKFGTQINLDDDRDSDE